MKIRNGFVSNSSSSSFLIYGTIIDEANIPKELFKKDNEDDEIDMYEIIENICADNNLEYNIYHEKYYVGKSWDAVADDQTGKQFKDSITATIKKVFLNIEDKHIHTFSEAWYDG